jgi:glycine/D-amino acid oxidase-like deaminating enzyme/nitrite reductase/ring-hydroxylating ferredoxin subunit
MTDTRSIWLNNAPETKFQPLAQDITADVCVIGGGIAGLTAAYRLLNAGRSVLLLEAEAPGRAETAHTTAHLAWVLDDRFSRLADLRGDDIARLAASSHQSAIADIEQTARDEGIECDFVRVPGYLFPGTDGAKIIDAEREAVDRLGLEHQAVDAVPLVGVQGLHFPGQARFHPVRYLAGLVEAVRKRGGNVRGGTRVVSVSGGETCTVETAGGSKVTASAVVVATNAPFDAGLTLQLRLAAYNTYALALPVAAGSVPDALYWDTDDPYHYVRLLPSAEGAEADYLIVGGEDHKTGQAKDQDDRWARLATWAKSRFPVVGEAAFHWSGQVFETSDGLGLIGAAPWGKNVYVITGDSGMGLTHGTLGGRLVSDLIHGKATPLEAVYSPSRCTPSAGFTLLKENANLAAQYTDWLTGGDVSSVDQIPPQHGAVLRRGLSKVAVYRKEDGSVCERSATCPHLGAVVRWNPGEQTWDCPAHGSRFAAEGKVQHGPAVSDLQELDK